MPFNPGDVVVHKTDKKKKMAVVGQAVKQSPPKTRDNELANVGMVPDGSYHCTWIDGNKKGEGYFMEVELELAS